MKLKLPGSRHQAIIVNCRALLQTRKPMIDVTSSASHRIARANSAVNPAASRLDSTETLLPDETAAHAATLAVLIVHEDLPTGLRAKQVLDRLRGQLGDDVRFAVKLWTFGTLRDPLLQRQAIHDVDQAQIVFISMHGNDEIPLALCDLLSRWLTAKEAEAPGALLVSLDANSQDSVSAKAVLDCLRTKAAASGVDLFQHFGAVPELAWNWSSQGSLSEASAGKPPTEGEGVELLEPFSKWCL
jgi:hypothetical protein